MTIPLFQISMEPLGALAEAEEELQEVLDSLLSRELAASNDLILWLRTVQRRVDEVDSLLRAIEDGIWNDDFEWTNARRESSLDGEDA